MQLSPKQRRKKKNTTNPWSKGTQKQARKKVNGTNLRRWIKQVKKKNKRLVYKSGGETQLRKREDCVVGCGFVGFMRGGSTSWPPPWCNHKPHHAYSVWIFSLSFSDKTKTKAASTKRCFIVHQPTHMFFSFHTVKLLLFTLSIMQKLCKSFFFLSKI